MIDKPQGQISGPCYELIDSFIGAFEDFGEILAAGWRSRFGKPVLLLSLVLLIGTGVYFGTYKDTVTVQTNIANSTITRTYKTGQNHVIEFIEEAGIDYDSSEDRIDCLMKDRIRDGMVITIDQPFDVTITADGESHSVRWIAPFTTQDVMDEFDLILGKNDRVSIALDAQPGQNAEIVINRIKIVVKKKVVYKDFKVKEVKDDSMYIGTSKVTQQGVKKKVKEITTYTYADGKLESKDVEEKVLKKGKKQIVHVGTKARPKSDGISGTLDVSGTPEEYIDKFSSCKITAYTDRVGARGAYGTTVHRGTCAVDPTVIPYGSLLYIKGYGYAVANDCGGAIKGKTIDIFLDSESQCVSWGVRYKTVYVIRYGPK